MYKLVSTLCLLFLSLSTSAQLTTNHSFESKGFDYDQIFKLSNGKIYAKHSKHLFKKSTYTLTALNENLALITSISKELISTKKEAHSINYIHFANALYQLSADGTPTHYTCSIQELDQLTLELKGSPIKLIDIQCDNKSASASITPEVSENGKFLAIKVPGGNLHIFNNELSAVTNYSVPYTLNSLLQSRSILSNNGSMYCLYSVVSHSSTQFLPKETKLIVTQWDLKGNSEQVVLENENFLLDPIMQQDKNGHILLTGSLGEITKESIWVDGNIDKQVMMKIGFYFYELDPDLKVVASTSTNYQNDMILDGLKPNIVKKAENAIEKGKKLGYQHFNLSQFTQTADGYLLMGEDYLYETKYDPQTKTSTDLIYHGSVLILKLDKKGNLLSYHKVFKSQYFTYYGGFYAYQAEEKLFVLFNDYKVNEQVENMRDVMDVKSSTSCKLYVVEISENGISKYAPADDVWKNKQFVPTNSRVINNTLFIFGLNGSNSALTTMKVD